MEIIDIERKANIGDDKKLMTNLSSFEKLIDALKKREMPIEIANSVNEDIEDLNTYSGSNKDFLKRLKKAHGRIIKLVEKELKLVTKNHYRNMWMALGMTVFGIPFGVAFGASLDNMAFIGIGIPIGMAVGIGIGTSMDSKALEEGRQLDLESES